MQYVKQGKILAAGHIACTNVLPQYSQSLPAILDNLNILRGAITDNNLLDVIEDLSNYGEYIVTDETAVKQIVNHLEEAIASTSVLSALYPEQEELLRDIPESNRLDYGAYELASADDDSLIIAII